jgi:hypothetical protein
MSWTYCGPKPGGCSRPERVTPEMSIAPESIRAGRWYLAKGGEAIRIRRVVQLMPDDRVQYEQRSPKTVWQSGIQELRSFAAMLEREVPCDWTQERDG